MKRKEKREKKFTSSAVGSDKRESFHFSRNVRFMRVTRNMKSVRFYFLLCCGERKINFFFLFSLKHLLSHSFFFFLPLYLRSFSLPTYQMLLVVWDERKFLNFFISILCVLIPLFSERALSTTFQKRRTVELTRCFCSPAYEHI